MYAVIQAHQQIIIQAIADTNHVARYTSLMAEFQNPNAPNDPNFQREFRSYWQMNMARLPNDWYVGFFNLLSATRDNPTDDIQAIVNSLEIPLQGQRSYKAFSFASKLLHTVNNNLPIYDRNVREFYFLPHFRTLEAIAAQFAFLRNEYARVMELNLLGESIHAFRETFHLHDHGQMSDVKITDSLIWKFVELMRDTPPLNRAILFQ